MIENNKLLEYVKRLDTAVTVRQKLDARIDLQYYLWQNEARALAELSAINSVHQLRLIRGCGPRGDLFNAVAGKMYDLQRGPVRPGVVSQVGG
jgi:hypothetical protein